MKDILLGFALLVALWQIATAQAGGGTVCVAARDCSRIRIVNKTT